MVLFPILLGSGLLLFDSKNIILGSSCNLMLGLGSFFSASFTRMVVFF